GGLATGSAGADGWPLATADTASTGESLRVYGILDPLIMPGSRRRCSIKEWKKAFRSAVPPLPWPARTGRL
ncbi:MAG TPA: hypothetical protein VGP68_06460, partial [Gemmataceae bacterium]|nr:hypothetical protein [Gemmataceae bacterium]